MRACAGTTPPRPRCGRGAPATTSASSAASKSAAATIGARRSSGVALDREHRAVLGSEHDETGGHERGHPSQQAHGEERSADAARGRRAPDHADPLGDADRGPGGEAGGDRHRAERGASRARRERDDGMRPPPPVRLRAAVPLPAGHGNAEPLVPGPQRRAPKQPEPVGERGRARRRPDGRRARARPRRSRGRSRAHAGRASAVTERRSRSGVIAITSACGGSTRAGITFASFHA